MGEWYRDFFGPDYLKAYGPRNRREAPAEVAFIETALEMRTSGLYLDLCCGEGRHAVPLAGKGYRMVGVDLSPSLLAAAARSACRSWPGCRFVRADAGKLPFRDLFDGVYCWFTSFGYSSSPFQDRAVLSEVRRVLRPGGIFLLEVLNHDFLVDHPREKKRILGDGCYLISEMEFCAVSGIATTRKVIHYPSGMSKPYLLTTRIYRLGERAKMFFAAGLEPITLLSKRPAEGRRRSSPPRLLHLLSRRPVTMENRKCRGYPRLATLDRISTSRRDTTVNE